MTITAHKTMRMIPLDAPRPDLEAKRLAKQAAWNEEFLVETNSGTFSSHDAVRAIGTSDPAFAEYRIFERVGDGRRRVEGCNPSRAPGTARRFSRELTAARHQLRDMK